MITPLSAPRERMLRRIFAVCVGVQVVGITVSIALSSIAFAVAAALFAVLALAGRTPVAMKTGLEWFFVAYVTAVLAMVAAAVFPVAALVNARRVLLISVAYFVPAAFDSERAVLRLVLLLAVVSALQSVADIIVYYGAHYERLGFFQHYMTAAGMKMFVVLLALPLALSSSVRPGIRVVLGVSLLVIFFALVLTQTRSSWLGVLAGATVIAVLRHRAVVVAMVVIGVAFLVFAPQSMRERIRHMVSTQQDGEATSVVTSNQTRVRMWSTGWKMFLEHPFLGVGDGEMGRIYRRYVPDALHDEGGHLHSTYVHVLASHGAVGFLAMMALFAAIVRLEWKTFRKPADPFAAAVALGALAAFAGFAVNGVAEYNFGDHEILVFLWLSVGLTVSAARFSPAARADAAAVPSTTA